VVGVVGEAFCQFFRVNKIKRHVAYGKVRCENPRV
jgi:hypothetical protein